MAEGEARPVAEEGEEVDLTRFANKALGIVCSVYRVHTADCACSGGSIQRHHRMTAVPCRVPSHRRSRSRMQLDLTRIDQNTLSRG
jgi:hypothetical protein